MIVGQQQVIEELLIAMFARGHCLLVGVPGLAKTLMIRTLADALSLEFSRIQFTPDLMPSDITGTEVIQEDQALRALASCRFCTGPIFANMILADEINRTPPKTQAALLEAMQEHQVTVGGRRHKLAEPFFVLATQNPIEQEGTYPLPEAQLDRFMFNIFVDYPGRGRGVGDRQADHGRRRRSRSRRRSSAEQIVELDADRPPRAGRRPRGPLRPAAGPADASPTGRRARFRQRVRQLGGRAAGQPVPGAGGQGPGRAAAAATTSDSDDIRAVALPVLRHRIMTNFNAEAEGITAGRHHPPADRHGPDR